MPDVRVRIGNPQCNYLRNYLMPTIQQCLAALLKLLRGRNRNYLVNIWNIHAPESDPNLEKKATKGVKSLVSRSLANDQDAPNRIVGCRFCRFRLNLSRETPGLISHASYAGWRKSAIGT